MGQFGKTLRKNNIAIDIITFGDVDANDKVLEALMASEEGKSIGEEDEEGNHMARIIPGQGSIVEAISRSPIIRSSSANGAATGDFEFGVDPEMDPELALALKLSMEEEKARQAKAVATAGSGDNADTGETNPSASVEPMEVDSQSADAGFENVEDEDEDALLQQAIALSMETAKKEESNPK